jgi:hypothetical protein
MDDSNTVANYPSLTSTCSQVRNGVAATSFQQQVTATSIYMYRDSPWEPGDTFRNSITAKLNFYYDSADGSYLDPLGYAGGAWCGPLVPFLGNGLLGQDEWCPSGEQLTTSVGYWPFYANPIVSIDTPIIPYINWPSPEMSVPPGETQPLSALRLDSAGKSTFIPANVTWSIGTGSNAGGSVDSQGKYTPPFTAAAGTYDYVVATGALCIVCTVAETATIKMNILDDPAPNIALGSGQGACAGAVSGDITENVVVGQPVSFTGCITTQYPSKIESAEWFVTPSVQGVSVGGVAVTFYPTSQQFVEKVIPTPSNTCSTDIYCDYGTLYFTKPGQYTFFFQYAMSDGPVSPETRITVNVSGPTPDINGRFLEKLVLSGPSSAPSVGQVRVWPVGAYWGLGTASTSPWLAIGDGNTNQGIDLQASGTMLGSGYDASNWSFIQLAQVGYSFTSAPQQAPVSFGGLDGGPVTRDYTDDSPGVDLAFLKVNGGTLNAVGEIGVAEQFTTYLMWDPRIDSQGGHNCDVASESEDPSGNVSYFASTCASVPVPVAVISWGWDGDAINTLNPNSGSNNETWILSCGSSYLNPEQQWPVYPTWETTATHFNGPLGR